MFLDPPLYLATGSATEHVCGGGGSLHTEVQLETRLNTFGGSGGLFTLQVVYGNRSIFYSCAQQKILTEL